MNMIITLFSRKKNLLPVILLLLAINLQAQNTNAVTGTVMNENGEMLNGVTVKAKGGKQSLTTITNEKGIFSFPALKVGTSYTLTASYVGYDENSLTSITPVQGSNNSVLIRLQPGNNALNEVVVIGYGTQKRETVTGAITTVRAKDFNTGQINDPLTLIAGKVAGLSVSNTDRSNPNAGADFSLRGPATVEGNSQPLIVIDGVPGGDLQTIAPNDIASIDVLKDGSAAAIYGSRATAGVIIITTKRGKAGVSKVNYSGYVTTSAITKKYNLLDAKEYIALGKKLQDKYPDAGISIDNAKSNTDWFDAVTRTPVSHSHNLSVSGGNDKTNYYASVNYRNSEGIDLLSEREFVNGTFRLNTTALNDKLDFGLTIVNSFDKRNFANYGAIAQSLNENPTYPVKNADGSFYERFDIPYNLEWNPVANVYQNSYLDKEKKFLGTVNAAYHIFPSLSASVTYSLIKNNYLSSSFSDIDDFFQLINGTNGQASRSEDDETDNILETTLNYDKTFGNHHFNAIAGYSYQDIYNEGLSAGNNNFITNAYRFYSLGAGSALNNLDPNANRSGVYVGSYANERTILAYFGRLIYDYKQKYLLNVSLRHEGASVLGADNKWGDFPGVSAGWILSKENFLAGSSIIKFLKLRAGYGVTGNQESLSPYQSLATIGPFFLNSQQAYFNGSYIQTYASAINANPLLEWETKSETNIGLDFTLLKNGWLTGSIDLYDRKIKHLVGNYSAQLPSQIYPTIFANAGTMENKGIEISLNAKVLNQKTFGWNFIFTGAYNKNEILSVTSNQFYGTAHDITRVTEGVSIQRLAPGEPVAVFYGPVFSGIDKNGLWQFKNNKGEVIGADELSGEDYKYLGNSIPKYTVGFTNNFSYGRFDVSLLLKGAFGFKAVNSKRMFHENLSYYSRNNLFTSALQTKLNDQAIFSNYYVENGSYVKGDNLNIGYTLAVKNSLYIQNVHFYITAANLFTITSFSGTNPEMQINYYPQDPNAETTDGPSVESNYGYYPNTRVYTLGIDINF